MLFYGSLAAQGSAAPNPNAASAARRAETKVEWLALDVERLLLITEALWTILKEKHGYSDADLITRVAAIDMKDGTLDGRVAKEEGPLNCPHCGRVLIGKRPVCLYCGNPVARDPFER